MGKVDRIKWIDSLKGLACIIVMITHAIAFDPEIGMYANGCGKIGVWLFMLISGILYARSTFHTSNAFTIRSLLIYFENKIIRIYPSYLFALVLLLAFNLINFTNIQNNLLFRSAWEHLWYIPVILKFYLIAPLFTLLKRVTDKVANHSDLFFYLVLIAIGTALAIFFPYPNYPENSIQLYWYLPVFIAGILLGSLKWEMAKPSILTDIGTIIGILVILVLTPLGRELLFGAPLSRYLQNKYLSIGACWVLVIVGCLYGKRTRSIVEAVPVFFKVASYSLELYLIHYIMLRWLTNNYVMTSWIKGLIAITVSFIIAFPLRKGLDLVIEKTNRKVLMVSIIGVYVIMIIFGTIVK